MQLFPRQEHTITSTTRIAQRLQTATPKAIHESDKTNVHLFVRRGKRVKTNQPIRRVTATNEKRNTETRVTVDRTTPRLCRPS